MNKILSLVVAAFFLGFTGLSFSAVIKPEPKVYTNWKITKVVDGDTVKIEVPGFPIEELPLAVRVLDIDTPEKAPRAQCEREANLALQASAFTRDMVANGKVFRFTRVKWDKYGGRVLAQVNIDGKDLAAALVNNGLARPYSGGRKASWCN